MDFDSFIRNIKWRLGKIFYSHERQKWQKTIFVNEDFKNGKIIPLKEYSTNEPIKAIERKRVICIYDGKTKNGGLADRLRGIVSVYKICKEQGLEFKIIFNSPFKLEKFIAPNIVDWHIAEQELNYNTKITDVCYIDTLTGSNYEAGKQEEWFTKEFRKGYKEYHVRTNAIFSYKSDYSTLFNELFTPSSRLQASIDREKSNLGTQYISTSFRFMNLLGDFNETTGICAQLPKGEKEELIEKNLKQLEALHKQFPEKKILVNSDSVTFLKHASNFEFVYIIPGNVTHIDANGYNDEYEVYEKTFLDFLMIANAEKIYLLRTGNMYNSGYPYAASLIYNRSFEKVEF